MPSFFMEARNIIPAHQFVFKEKYGTIEKVNKEYWHTIFLNVYQAFDRFWLKGLMHKIKTHLPVL